MTPNRFGSQDPRRIVLDSPWDFLGSGEKDEVLRTTCPWSRITDGLSVGSCLEAPRGFDLVATLDDRIANCDELAPPSTAEHLTWNINDGAWPEIDQLVSLAATIDDRLTQGLQVLVRCMAGLNRSGLVCAAVLVRRGSPPDDAIKAIRTARSRHALCNPQFIDLISRMQPGIADLGLTAH